MKNKEEIAVVVQARMSSTRCPKKMTKNFSNTTLLDVLFEKLKNSKIPNSRIFVSVHEDPLIEKCKEYPFNLFKRSKESALSEGESIKEIFEWWDKIPFKYVVMINACCPFLRPQTIENFYHDYSQVENNGMFAVFNKKNYVWSESGDLLTPLSTSLNTKSMCQIKEAAHVLYAGCLSDIGNNVWMGDFSKNGEVLLWDKIEEKEALDIDYQWQFDMCEALYSGGFK